MKRNWELIRTLILHVEADDTWPKAIQNIAIDGYEDKDIQYHLFLMEEAGLIRGIDASTRAGKNMLVLRLTWEGHEFAANSKNPSNWEKLTNVLGTLGDVSFDVAKTCLAAIAGSAASVAVSPYLIPK